MNCRGVHPQSKYIREQMEQLAPFTSFDQLLDYGQKMLTRHRNGLLQNGIAPYSHTGLEESCSGEAWDKIYEINRYVFTTGSTNTFYINKSFPEPMWLGMWLPLSMATDMVGHVEREKYPVACIVQNLSTKKILINTMDLSLHRWWSADGIKSMEMGEKAHLQQCSAAFAAASESLFNATDPIVGMWIECDDETNRDMYDFILKYLQIIQCQKKLDCCL